MTLKEVVSLMPGQVLSEYLLFEAVQDLRKEYEDHHYHNVEIEPIQEEGELQFSRI